VVKLVTLRNIPPHIAQTIRRRADSEGLSVNKTVIRILEESLSGRKNKGRETIHHDLDRFSGSWTKREADEFDKDLAEQRRIDPSLWR
jgi:plasmid stability protein